MNSTHFYITPNNIFHSFPVDLCWIYYYLSMLCKLVTSLLQSTCFGLVPDEAWEAGGGRGQDVQSPSQAQQILHPQSPLCHLTPAGYNSRSWFPQHTQHAKKSPATDTQVFSVSVHMSNNCFFWSFLPLFCVAILVNWIFMIFLSTWQRGVMKQEQNGDHQGEEHQGRSHHQLPIQVG